MSFVTEAELGKAGSVAENDSSGIECLRSKVDEVGKRVRVDS